MNPEAVVNTMVLNTRRRRFPVAARLAVAAAVAVAVLPAVASPYVTLVVLPALAYGVALLGLNLLLGSAGLLSFGHALFLALGAYTAAWCTGRLGVRHLEVSLVAAAAVGAAVAVPVGALCVRSARLAFSMLTLAFSMLFWSFLVRFSALTGGDQGLPVGQPSLLGRSFAAEGGISFLTGPYYLYTAGVLFLLGLLMWRIVHSPFGLCLRATRDQPLKAGCLGITVARRRFAAFVISAVYAALAGALLAPVSGLADPTLAHWTQSGFLVFMVILGGYRTFAGPLLGALAFVILQDLAQATVDEWRLVVGTLLAVVVIVAPGGLAGLARVAGRGTERGVR